MTQVGARRFPIVGTWSRSSAERASPGSLHQVEFPVAARRLDSEPDTPLPDAHAINLATTGGKVVGLSVLVTWSVVNAAAVARVSATSLSKRIENRKKRPLFGL